MNMKKIITFTLLVLAVLPLIYSAGVANSYWDENPLKLSPGESTTISLRLQNEENTSITLEATLNSTIAKLVNSSIYVVPPNRESIPVYIKVEIPLNAEIGAKYDIPVSFQQTSSGSGGMVKVAQGITAKIPVTVVNSMESELYKPATQNQGTSPAVYIIAVVLILAIIITALVIKKKKTTSKQ
ncbi:MAG: hypothetical protein AABW63_04125 [Nanoarchaeota archaeon]